MLQHVVHFSYRTAFANWETEQERDAPVDAFQKRLADFCGVDTDNHQTFGVVEDGKVTFYTFHDHYMFAGPSIRSFDFRGLKTGPSWAWAIARGLDKD